MAQSYSLRELPAPLYETDYYNDANAIIADKFWPLSGADDPNQASITDPAVSAFQERQRAQDLAFLRESVCVGGFDEQDVMQGITIVLLNPANKPDSFAHIAFVASADEAEGLDDQLVDAAERVAAAYGKTDVSVVAIQRERALFIRHGYAADRQDLPQFRQKHLGAVGIAGVEVESA